MTRAGIKLIILILIVDDSLFSQCNITVNAGPDLKVCNAGDMIIINGKVTGNITQIFWDPPTGLSNPKSPVTKATVSGPQEYILTARGLNNQNLIVNGNFEAGNTGFTTDYVVGTMSCYGAGYLDCEGTYDVINNPQLGHTAFAPCGDHTSGSGLMMVLNGAANFQNVWCEDVNVIPDMDYVFTAWITSVISASPPILQFSINGNPIGPNFASSGVVCQWEKYEVTWNSGSSTVAQICILNENTATGGNDFAIDDLSFKKICEVKDTMKIDIEEINIEIEEPEVVTCDHPMIKLNAKASSSGTGWTYQWFTSDGKIISGANTLEPTIKGPGTYYLTICSPIPNCCLTKSIEVMGNIIPPDLLLISNDTLGCNNLSASIFSRSKVSPLLYLWDGPNGFNSMDPIIVVVEPGKYILTITDEYNCKTIDSIEVFEKIDNPKISIKSNNINCKQDSARLLGTSTVPGSKFEWTGPNNTVYPKDQWNVVDTGIYILKVSSPTGCIKYDTVRILKDNQSPILNFRADTITCLRDSSSILVTANRKITNAMWQSPHFYYVLDTLSIRTGSAGIYTLQVEADNGCVSTLTVNVIADTMAPKLNPVSDTITCLKPSTLLISSNTDPKILINWSGPNGFMSNKDSIKINQAGTYLLNAVAENGCNSMNQIQIAIDTLHPALKTKDDTLNCLKTSLNLTLFDSLLSSYFWTGPNNFTSNLKNPSISNAGLYQLRATLPNGCFSDIQSEVISDFIKPVITVYDDTLTCKKDSTRLIASIDNAKATLIWNGPAGFYSNTINPYIRIPGTYTLKATNPNGCIDSSQLTIYQDIRKPDLFVLPDTLNCMKRVGVLKASSTRDSLLFSWSGPAGFISDSQNITINRGGTYTIKASTPDNCYSLFNVEVLDDTIKPDITLFPDTLNCLKIQSSLKLNSNSPILSFQWQGPGNFNSAQKNPVINQGGIYRITTIGNNQCVKRDSVYILQDTTRPIIQYSFDSINCFHREVDLIASVIPSNLTGEWTFPNQQKIKSNSIKSKIGGDFIFDVVHTNFCINSISLFIPVDTLKPDLNVNNDTINCTNPIAEIIANSKTNRIQYEWKGPGSFTSNQAEITSTVPGLYIIRVVAPNGCENSQSSFIEIDTLKPQLITSSDSIDCIHPEATLIASSNISNGIFKWTNSQGQFITSNNLLKTRQGGIYNAEIINPANGCFTLKSQEVKQDSLIIIDAILKIKNPVCGAIGGTLNILNLIGGHQNIRYSIDQKLHYTSNPVFESLPFGRYTLYVIDDKNCEFQKDFEIIDIPNVNTDLSPELSIELGDSTKIDLNILTDQKMIKSIFWSPSDYLSCTDCEDPYANPPATSYYEVTVTDTNGCTSTKRVRIVVETPKIWLPNVFSPNGDNINDIVFIHGSKEEVTKINVFQIFDRWGNKVFENKNFQPNDQSSGWNGMFNSQKCNPGVFVYWAEVELINGLKWKVNGDLTLIR